MKNCSFGTVPYRLIDGNVTFLLVQEKDARHWSCPKGREKIGETPSETSLRKLEEETALVPSCILEHTPLIEKYTMRKNTENISRELVFMVVRVDEWLALNPNFDCIYDARWMTDEEIYKKTKFKALHTLIEQAFQIIKVHEKLA